MHFIFSNKKGTLTRDSGVLGQRVKDRGIDAYYVNENYLFDRLSDERMKYARDRIGGDDDAVMNSDFRPAAYHYATIFWGTHFDEPILRAVFHGATAKVIWSGAGLFCLLIFGLRYLKRAEKKHFILLAVSTTGFAEIIFQIAVLLSFQVIYGFMFYKVGIIISAFMVGLASGGWIISRQMHKIKDHMVTFRKVQLGICLYPLILPVVFVLFSRTESAAAAWTGSNIVFPLLRGSWAEYSFRLRIRYFLRKRPVWDVLRG